MNNALLMGVLLIGFFRIQVLQGEEARLRASSNRLRFLPVPAPRGTIYDRNGEIIADNVPGYQITILPAPVDSVRATLRRMQRYIHLSDARIERVIQTLRQYGREVVVDSDADFQSIAALEALSRDVPAIVSKQSGVTEVLSNVVAVDFWDVDTLADQVVRVLEQPELGKRLAEQGHADTRQLTWARQAQPGWRRYPKIRRK